MNTMNPYRLPDAQLEAMLLDDTPFGDATTHALAIGDRAGRLVFRARYAMLVCGSEEAQRLGELRGLQAAGPARSSGSRLAAGEEILTLQGPASALHTVWKTAQTLMEYLSGIASTAAAIVDAARQGHPEASVVCTRKNFPGTKAAAIKAVLCAGASPHRLSLSETLLLFAEHRAFLGDEAPPQTVARLRRLWPERSIVVEVASHDEALRWAEAGADILQLEKMAPVDVARIADTLAHAGLPARLAAAGGVHAGNARAFVDAGARILVSSAPYFAPPQDVAVTLEAL